MTFAMHGKLEAVRFEFVDIEIRRFIDDIDGPEIVTLHQGENHEFDCNAVADEAVPAFWAYCRRRNMPCDPEPGLKLTLVAKE